MLGATEVDSRGPFTNNLAGKFFFRLIPIVAPWAPVYMAWGFDQHQVLPKGATLVFKLLSHLLGLNVNDNKATRDGTLYWFSVTLSLDVRLAS